MRTDPVQARRIPFVYVSPPVCDFIFSASGEAEVFINLRAPGTTYITGFTITYADGIYRLQWDTFPGALCYSVYKLVDELDPFSSYVLVAECITDDFLDTTDPGAYAVVPVTPDGEGDFPPPTQTPEPPPPCFNVPPDLTGDTKYVCPDKPTSVDLRSLVSGGTPPFSYSASASSGTASVDGNVLTYTAPEGAPSTVVNITVTDACGDKYHTAINMIPYDKGTFNSPGTQEVCGGDTLNLDIADYIDVPAEQGQTFQVQSANIFDQGGSVVFGEGSGIAYTPNSNNLGNGTLSFCATDQCGNEICGDIPILVKCADCTEAMKDVTTQSVTGSASGGWSGGYGEATSATNSVPFVGTVACTPWMESAVTVCQATIVVTGVGSVFYSVNVNGTVIKAGGTTGTFVVGFSTKVGNNGASITVGNSPGGSCTCQVLLGEV